MPKKKKRLNLSVIIPTRNADYMLLERAIDSALSIGAEPCIFFDAYPHELKTFPSGRRLDSLPCYAIDRIGKISAMNRLLHLASKDFFIFHGDDDFIGAGAIELVKRLEADDSLVFAYGNQQYMGNRTDLHKPRQYTGDDLYYSNVPLNAVVYRRAVAIGAGGYADITGNLLNPAQPEDYGLLLTIYEAGGRGVYVDTPAPVLHYTLSYDRSWAMMQNNADEIYRLFKARYPKYLGGRL